MPVRVSFRISTCLKDAVRDALSIVSLVVFAVLLAYMYYYHFDHLQVARHAWSVLAFYSGAIFQAFVASILEYRCLGRRRD